MALSEKDPHSYAKPDNFAVRHTHLELFVDFERTVLSGEAILTIRRKNNTYNKITLDIHGLTIISVIDMVTGANLECNFKYRNIFFGKKLIIKIPVDSERVNLLDNKIQIKYETSPNSPALYWLTPKQTSDGTHPLLISNSKLTYARAIFPCQDTPSNRFTFSAKISVPMGFNVMMNAKKTGTFVESNLTIHYFSQKKIPSYAMVIVVGSLEERIINQSLEHSKIECHMWAEKKYIQQSKEAFVRIMEMMSIVKLKFYGYFDEFNVCVLPPCMPEFDVQCPSVTFVSSTLLCDDDLVLSIILQNILESLIADIFQIQNFENLWLIKSISTFIYRTIIHIIFGEETKKLLEVKGNNDMIKLYNLKRMPLAPRLIGILPNNIIKYVPYEKGYWLWDYLRNLLGFTDSIEFIERYIVRYIERYIVHKQRRSFISTETLKYFVLDIFQVEVLNSVDWNMWFYDVRPPPNNFYSNRIMYCHSLADQYMTTQTKEMFPLTAKVNEISTLEKIEFLSYLHALPTALPIEKLRILRFAFLKDQICELRFLWFRLYIKSRRLEMTRQALEFACEYCIPKYACSIFRDLYNWTETRHLAISWFEANYKKMLPETVKELELILHFKLRDMQ